MLRRSGGILQPLGRDESTQLLGNKVLETLLSSWVWHVPTCFPQCDRNFTPNFNTNLHVRVRDSELPIYELDSRFPLACGNMVRTNFIRTHHDVCECLCGCVDYCSRLIQAYPLYKFLDGPTEYAIPKQNSLDSYSHNLLWAFLKCFEILVYLEARVHVHEVTFIRVCNTNVDYKDQLIYFSCSKHENGSYIFSIISL